MADNAPVVDEFGRGACLCGGTVVGCAVCTAASILIRYGKPIPRLSDGTPDMVTLGRSMGARHRRAEPRSRHGICPQAWCAYCIYLELKARGVPVAYGALSDTQIKAHLKASHSIAVPGLYGRVPLVPRNSYSNSDPARGRSDAGMTGRHMVAAHGGLWAGATLTKVILADPDFGSPSRPVVPPHSLWTWAIFAAFRHALMYQVCYTTVAPRSVSPPAPTAGVTYRYGGRPVGRGSFRLRGTANVRTSPFVRGDNVVKAYPKGTTFACAQTTVSGTNVGGSSKWRGTKDGRHWIHDSLVAFAGHTTGKETVR